MVPYAVSVTTDSPSSVMWIGTRLYSDDSLKAITTIVNNVYYECYDFCLDYFGDSLEPFTISEFMGLDFVAIMNM